MTTLTVDRIELLADHSRSAVIVIDGVLCHSERCGAIKSPPTVNECRCKGKMQPPFEIVALTEPCQTCDGCGHECTDGVTTIKCRNPSCRDGKPTFTLHQRCYACNGGALGHWTGDGWTITDVQPRDDGKFEIHAEQETS